MTLKQQMASDLGGVFFSEADFAEPAVYRPALGPEYALAVLFEDAYQESEPGGMGSVQAQAIRVQVPTAAFSAPPAAGDTIMVRQVTYRVISAHPDGVGVTTLALHEVD